MFLTGCTAPKKVIYFEDAQVIPSELLNQIPVVVDPVINVGDLLNIQVASLNMTAAAPFNKGNYIDHDGRVSRMTSGSSSSMGGGLEASTDYYLVNSEGCIEFPILGTLKVVGMTNEQVAQMICNEIYPKYITDRPVVDVRLMNFRVTMLGAVRSPGVYQSRNGRMTFTEAIAMAGDLDIKGSRDNILLFRTNADGTHEVHRLDIHDRDFLLSPYYNLQQNDLIYVEPNKSMRHAAWQMNPAVNITIGFLGTTMSLFSFIVGIINLTK